ncbi:MAG: cell division ATP-binding protein FtsE [Eubacteriaceae bacterium]|nr:cell division ATP-binding protein FtsE [Eubacteriaceae bacterium]MBR2780949.1 cell division ATP-binding protein FtsE [Eubacteriaceae bacterium]
MIDFVNVSMQYEGEEGYALRDINLSIDQGEFVFLVGKSGAGKSTFIKLLLREMIPTEGTITISGTDLDKISDRKLPFYRRKIGVVFQDYKLLENRTVFDNVAFAMEAVQTDPKTIARIVPKILSMVGLRDKSRKFPESLSGGEQQRVAIARSIVNNPRILICDEPTGNLDPVTSSGIMNLLLDINKLGTTVIIATHDITMVDRLRKRVLSLQKGQLVGDRVGGYYN